MKAHVIVFRQCSTLQEVLVQDVLATNIPDLVFRFEVGSFDSGFENRDITTSLPASADPGAKHNLNFAAKEPAGRAWEKVWIGEITAADFMHACALVL